MQASDRIPKARFGESSSGTDVTVIAGKLDGAASPLAPPPDSWASRPESGLAIWTIRMDPGARWTLPPARYADSTRHLYFFAGSSVELDGRQVGASQMITLDAGASVDLLNGEGVA